MSERVSRIGRFHWRERYGVLGILLTVYMVSYMDRKAIYLVLPMIAEEFGVGPLALGFVSSVFSAAFALGQVPGGMLADRFGIRRVASGALFWWSAFIGLTGFVGNFTQLLITRFFFGLGEGLYPACLFKTIANWFPRNGRAMAASLVFAAGDLGKALAPAFVLTVAAIWGWRSAFLALFVPGAIMALAFFWYVADSPAKSHRVSPEELAEIEDEQVRPEEGGASATDGRKIKAWTALRQPFVLSWFLILFFFSIVTWAFPVWLPTYLVQDREFSLFEMGLASTLSAGTGAGGSVICGWLTDKYFSNSRHVLLIASQILSVLSVLLMIYATSAFWIIAGATLSGFFMSFFYPAFWSMPMVYLSKETLGLSSGVINLGGQIGGLLGPVLVGLALQVTGSDYVIGFLVQVAALLLSLVVTVIAFSGARRRPAILA